MCVGHQVGACRLQRKSNVRAMRQTSSNPSCLQVVRAWDVRDVSDQVHSMGAKWVTVDFKVPEGCWVDHAGKVTVFILVSIEMIPICFALLVHCVVAGLCSFDQG